MRRKPVQFAAILVVALAAALLLSACSKGSPSSSTTTTIVHTTAPKGGGSAGGSKAAPGGGGDSGKGRSQGGGSQGAAPTHARALAFAQAVNLTASDVPGFTPSEKDDSSSPHEKQLEHQITKCVGGSGVGGSGSGSGSGAKVPGEHATVLEQNSKEFQLKHQIIDFSVSSEVSVQASAAEARAALAAIRNSRVRSCFSHYLQLLFAGEHVKGAKTGPVTIQSGVPPAPGTAGGFGWRITASFTVRGIKVPVYLDFLGFVDGPAEVTLLSSGLIRPFPAPVQQHLYQLLLSRAKEHSL